MPEQQVETTKERGRPSAYSRDFDAQVYKLCLLGATDEEISDFFGVSVVTLNAWKNKHPNFLKAMSRGKLWADAEVASKLRERANGYEHDAVKIFVDKGQPLVVPYTEKYAPDTAAASLWLRNRQPTKWRDKVDHELSGPNGGPIQTEVVGNDLDLARRVAALLEGAADKAE